MKLSHHNLFFTALFFCICTASFGQMSKWMKVAQGMAPAAEEEQTTTAESGISTAVSKIDLITTAGTSSIINDGEQKIIFRCYVTKEGIKNITEGQYFLEVYLKGLPNTNNSGETLFLNKSEDTEWSELATKGYLDVDFSPEQSQDLENTLDNYNHSLNGNYPMHVLLKGINVKLNPLKGVVTTQVLVSEGNFTMALKGMNGAYAGAESEEMVESFNSGYHSNKINNPTLIRNIATYFKTNYNLNVTHVSLSSDEYKDSGQTRRYDVYVVYTANEDGKCGYMSSMVDTKASSGAITNVVPQDGDQLSCEVISRIVNNVK